jgi:hypothetical protein
MRIGSYVSFGVGALGLGLGALFLAKSSSKRSDANDAFDACLANPTCRVTPESMSPEKKKVADLDDQATGAARVGVAGIIVGVAGVGAGVALLVMSSKGSSSETKTGKLVPIVSPGYVGLTGSF